MSERELNDNELTSEQADAVRTWSNVGAPGPPPSKPFVPDAERLREFYEPIVKPVVLEIELPLRRDDFEQLRLGHEAMEMEDKWNVYCDDSLVVHFHRSWTGFECFRLELGPSEDGDLGGRRLTIETEEDRVRWTIEDALESFTELLVWVFRIDPEYLVANLKAHLPSDRDISP